MAGIGTTIEIHGIEELQELLSQIPQASKEEAQLAIQDFADQMLTEAQQVVPIGGEPTSPHSESPGTLLESGQSEAIVEDDVVGARVSFGEDSPAEDYALRQEMDDDYEHKAGQKAHYLGDVVDSHIDEFAPLVAEAVSRAIESI